MSHLTSTVAHGRRPCRLAAVCAAVAVLALAGCSGDGDDASAPSAPPSRTTGNNPSNDPVATKVPSVPSAPEDDATAPGNGKDLGADTVTLPAKERDAVTNAADDYLTEVRTKLSKPDAETEPIEYADVTGPALESLLNTVSEYDRNGWKVTGRAKVVSEQVVRRTTKPDALVLRVCLDNSGVAVSDADGKLVPNSRPSTPRTLNVLTLVPRDGAWIVADQRPAEKPDC